MSFDRSSSGWDVQPLLVGALIRLEPLAPEYAEGYLRAAGDSQQAAEVFRWLNPGPGLAYPEPRTLADARQHLENAFASQSRGERYPFVQLDAVTGEVAGTTSYYDVSPPLRTLAIGHTWLGQRWWRTGHNTESKLLLLRHAFETLGAVRVVWHTDIYNVRSQNAIARLGATREGVLRKHRIRFDGSWRDTVQYAMTDDDWPAARARLQARLMAD